MDELCSNFHVDYCYPFFRSRFLINSEEQETIQSLNTRQSRTRCLLEILLTKDIEFAFNSLKEYIDEKSQKFLIDGLDKKYEENKF